MKTTQEPQTIAFKTQTEWERWLSKNYTREEGIWLKFFKKNSGIESTNYAEALDVALCYGWIDGQAKSLDEKAYLQKFTPRRKRSLWSERNKGHVERLTNLGKMKPSGLSEVERAKNDGRWERSYSTPANAKPPKDFLEELEKNKVAKEFFEKLSKSNTYAIIWSIENAKKEETRKRRIKKFVETLGKKEIIH